MRFGRQSEAPAALQKPFFPFLVDGGLITAEGARPHDLKPFSEVHFGAGHDSAHNVVKGCPGLVVVIVDLTSIETRLPT